MLIRGNYEYELFYLFTVFVETYYINIRRRYVWSGG